MGTDFFWPAEIMAAQKLQSFREVPFQVIDGSNVQCMCFKLSLLYRREKYLNWWHLKFFVRDTDQVRSIESFQSKAVDVSKVTILL